MKSTWMFAPLVSVALIVSAHGQENDHGEGQDQPRASTSQEDPLIGVWRFETTFAPSLDAELSVSHTGKSWSAKFAGADVAFDPVGKRLEFAFREGLGRFRGALADDASAITGFWIRPGVTADPRYPGGSSQAFATPVTLAQARPNEWHGRVQTLEDSLTLFLRIHRDETGKLVGAFRDQGQNSVGGAMQFQVTPRGNGVELTTQSESSEPALKATLTPGKTLRLFWSDLGRDIELTRLAPADAGAYYPRPPAGLPYAYRAPQETGDGWLTARAGEVGFDEAAITRVVQQIASSDPSDRRPSLIHSLLVAYRGRLVVEEYFFGFDRDRPHDLRSAGKTFASAMLGAAMLRGVKIAPETPVYDLFGGVKAFANPEPRKSRVTLASLMTHTSGLACDDNNEASPGNEDTMQNQREQPDWWRYTLDLPLLHEPGQRYAYCSANMNLVGGALTKATDTWLPAFFDRTVARPLQFGSYHWNLMPNGEGYLGGGSWLRPRDLLKVGQVYLDGGTWRGQRIVAADWVTQSTAPRIHISPATTGLDAEQFGDSYIEADDAYAWHLGGVRSGDRTYRDYAASGNGGQLLLVIPELEMVVVFTGGNYRQGGIWLRWPDEIVGKHLIPALRR